MQSSWTNAVGVVIMGTFKMLLLWPMPPPRLPFLPPNSPIIGISSLSSYVKPVRPVSWLFVWLPDLELCIWPPASAVCWIFAFRDGISGGLCCSLLAELGSTAMPPTPYSCLRIRDSFTVMLLLNPLLMLYIVEATEVLWALMIVILVLSFVLL